MYIQVKGTYPNCGKSYSLIIHNIKDRLQLPPNNINFIGEHD